MYEGVRLQIGFRADLIVRDLVLVELKSIQQIQPRDEARLLNHLRLSRLRVGLLINFNVLRLKEGIIRRVL